MIQISFQLFVILIFTDVLREIRRDIAENLEETKFPQTQKDNEVVPQLRERLSND